VSAFSCTFFVSETPCDLHAQEAIEKTDSSGKLLPEMVGDTCICVYKRVRTRVCVCVFMCVFKLSVCLFICMRACARVYMHMCVCKCVLFVFMCVCCEGRGRVGHSHWESNCL